MLAQVPGLKVAGRTSSFSFKGKNQDLRLIGEQLSVNHILEGSVRKSGNKLRITAQLIKVADGFQLYSEKFDRELEDIFEIQDEISLAILNAIKIKLFPEEKETVLKRYTDNVEAYQLYMQGRYLVYKYNGTEAFLNGIKYYEEAIKIEPGFALAYAGLAYCYMELSMDSLLPPEQCVPQMYFSQQYGKGMEMGKRLIQMEPAFFGGHYIVGSVLMFEKRYDEAKPLLEMAVSLYPIFMPLRTLATLYWKMGKEASCRELIAEMEVLGKTTTISNRDMGVIYTVMGEFDVAASYFEKGIEKREGMMLFAKYDIMMIDETLYVPQIEQVIEKVEAFKRVK